ncbi:MAG: hypothetical protein AAGA31_11420 [Bacteroidota bacterium]
MIDTIHRLKHWMLFIPLILPTLIQYGLQFAYMGKLQAWQQEMIESEGEMDFMLPDLEAYSSYVIAFILITVISYGVSIAWMWSIGGGLRKYLPTGTNLKLGRFKFTLIFQSLAYGAMLVGGYLVFQFMVDLFPTINASDGSPEIFQNDDFWQNVLIFWGIFMVLALALFASVIYSAYFVGKTLKSIELGRPAKGGEVIGYLILTVLLFIGIWMMQPKVNRLVETGTMEKPGDDTVWGE